MQLNQVFQELLINVRYPYIRRIDLCVHAHTLAIMTSGRYIPNRAIFTIAETFRLRISFPDAIVLLLTMMADDFDPLESASTWNEERYEDGVRMNIEETKME